MKTSIYELLFLPALVAGLGFFPAGEVSAQALRTFYGFTNGSDGASPQCGLILSGNTLYGTTTTGGMAGNGTVFALNTNGTGFSILYGFTNDNDGANPQGGLILSGDTLYGTTTSGGMAGKGTVFALNTSGTAYTNLYDFANESDGAAPYAGLVLSGNTLYGTAAGGGSYGEGTVFAVYTDGSGYTNLHNFAATDPITSTNSDGAYPTSRLVLSGNTLYGTAENGGISANGSIFSINTDGTDFTNLHSFTARATSKPHTNYDGSDPFAGLILSGDTLYGVTHGGGMAANGTVFALKTNGADFTVLYDFSDGQSEGSEPSAGLYLAGSTLYGTARFDGSAGNGTVFAVATNGQGFTTLHNFTATAGTDSGGNPAGYVPTTGTNSDGASPAAYADDGVILSANTLYGTAQCGGKAGWGTVFSLVIQPQVSIASSLPYVILTWPTNAAGFTLQSTSNLSLMDWSNVSTAPVIVNGQFTVTNSTTSVQQFYKLIQ